MEQLTLFPKDFLASLTVLPGSEKAKKMTVTSGQKCLGSSMKLDPLGLLVRTLLISSIWSSTERFLTWKVSVTRGNRLLYRLVPSMPNTEENEPLSWPTPTVADTYTDKLKSTQQKPGSMHSVNLSQAVQMYPTPVTRDYRGARTPEKLKEKGRYPTNSLPDFVRSQGENGQLNPEWVEWLMGFPIGWTELNL